jgi:hypothetical protein
MSNDTVDSIPAVVSCGSLWRNAEREVRQPLFPRSVTAWGQVANSDLGITRQVMAVGAVRLTSHPDACIM